MTLRYNNTLTFNPDLSSSCKRKLAVALENIAAANEIATAISDAIDDENVTRQNDEGIIYIVGDADTDGSVRLVAEDVITRVEVRDLGVWNLGEFEVSAGTLLLGENVQLSAVGTHLQVGAVEGDVKRLMPALTFDDTGSRGPHTPILSARQNRIVLQSDNSNEVLSTEHIFVITDDLSSIAYTLYAQSGEVGSSAIINLEITEGEPPNDVPFWSRRFPAESWPANTEAALPFYPGLSFDFSAYSGNVDRINVKATSENAFSVKYNADLSSPWFAADLQPQVVEPIFSFPTGFNRILVDEEGDTIVTQNGNLIASGTY